MRRLSLDDNDAKVRRWFEKEMKTLGCCVKVDNMGNMFAVRPGKKEGAPVAIGSHFDTQPTLSLFLLCDPVVALLWCRVLIKFCNSFSGRTLRWYPRHDGGG